ncbi:MAG TPA: TIGR03790 family protein [Steroidobacteraceae bacterium]|nr:TIGR03790 family protein [Steroidobacteraceae bacterium]
MTRAEWRCVRALALVLTGLCATARTEGLEAATLGVVFNRSDPVSVRVAAYYAGRRGIPQRNLVALELPDQPRLSRDDLARLRATVVRALPPTVESLLLIWNRPYAVECMSVTTAFAAGYRQDFCAVGCSRTRLNPLLDSGGWSPGHRAGWLPAMLLPTSDETVARRLIDRGIAADGTRPTGTVYLVRTDDTARNVRSVEYPVAESIAGERIGIRVIETPIHESLHDILAYFTGAVRVEELPKLGFRAGAVADHLTSTGGVLEAHEQMSILDWLAQGATGSYGTVSEPCNILGKFPSPAIFLDHYLRGETLLEAYWKSVAMPGQGLFVGEPLARPYPRPHH